MIAKKTVHLQPTFFSPIEQYAAILQSDSIVFEIEDNFQKQTYRNRCYIHAANGRQMLNVPLIHQKSVGKIKTKDVLIDQETNNWQSNHIKSMQAAYRSSPFYEFYEDDIEAVLNKKHKYLLDLNIDLHEFVMECLQASQKFMVTTSYEVDSEFIDCRNFSNAKKESNATFPEYTQTFKEKHGFLKNLSILDLLCMEGPASFVNLNKIQLLHK